MMVKTYIVECELGTFVKKTMKKWQLPGLAVAVVKDGEVVFAKGYGHRHVIENQQVTPTTIFAIGSSTKAFAATAIGILVDEGRLAWDTPVREYMPEFKMFDPVASQKITPRDLLCHRSGLPRHELMWYNSTASRKELIERLQHLQPTHDFRSTWQYQNLMYLTAGYLVERVTGMSWEAFVQERILQPLGMGNTNFSVEDTQRENDYAFPHDKRDEEIKVIPFRNISTIGPAGSINSNVLDMAKWVALNLAEGKMGEDELISNQNIKEMHVSQMAIPPDMIEVYECNYPETPSLSYGLGWFVQVYRGRKIIHHGGNIDGFSAYVSFMPEENTGVVVLSNSNGNPVPAITGYAIYDRLLGLEPLDWNKRYTVLYDKMKEMDEKAKETKVEERIEDTSPTHPLEAYVGTYQHPGYGKIEVRLCDEGLTATYNAIDFKLVHYHYNVFDAEVELYPITILASFEINKQGKIAKLCLPFEPSLPHDLEFCKIEL